MSLIEPVYIESPNSSIPTKYMRGIDKDGNYSNSLDFYDDLGDATWWKFFGPHSQPSFRPKRLTYSIAVKSTYDCTGTDAELQQYKNEFKRVAVEYILNYYNKKYTEAELDFLVSSTNKENANITQVIDNHLEAKPSSKLKFLVETDARYINALPNNPAPSSFSNNLNNKGGLIIKQGFLNPETEDPTTGQLENDKGIFIVELDSQNYETLIERTVFFMMNWDSELQKSGMYFTGVDLKKEAEYLQEATFLIDALVLANLSRNGYSTGKNLTTQEFLNLNTSNGYFIRLAFQEDPDSGEYYIPWASVKINGNDKDYILDVGHDFFINSHPLDSQTTLRYLFSYQRILKNFDLGIELNATEFVAKFHYPPVSLSSEIKKNKSLAAPFDNFNKGNYNNFSDPDKKAKKQKPKCGFKPYPPDFNFDPNWADLLGKYLQPINFTVGAGFSLFSLGPPCPAGSTSILSKDIIGPFWSSSWNQLVNNVSKDWKNIEKVAIGAKDEIVDTVNYYGSERWSNDVKASLKKAWNSDPLSGPPGTAQITFNKMHDIVTSRFTTDRILQAVCICITQLADDYMIENTPGYAEANLTTGLNFQTPNIGAGFNPQTLVIDLLADESQPTIGPNGEPTTIGELSFNQKLQKATQLYGFEEKDWELFMQRNEEPLRLQKLCSFCINFPNYFLRLPTFDLLRALLSALIDAIVAILCYLLIQLLLALIDYLFGLCPKYKCSIRPEGAATGDFGALNLDDFFPDNFNISAPENNILKNCPALNIPEDSISEERFLELQTLLFARISSELSSGQLANMLEANATETTYETIREIILEEEEFSDLAVFFSKGSRRKVEALVICIFENIDDDKVNNIGNIISDPSYCPPIDNTPAGILSEKCNNEEQVKKFLTKEKLGQYASLKGIIDDLKNNPNFFGDMLPQIFNTTDEDTGETQQGLLSDPKFKPEVIQTLVENLKPYFDNINKTARYEGSEVLNKLIVDGPPNSLMPNDSDLEVQSGLQLAGSLALLTQAAVFPPLAAAAYAFAPFGSVDSDTSRKLDSTYPLVGGPNLKPALDDFEDGGVSYALKPNQTGEAFGLGSDRKFGEQLLFNDYKSNDKIMKFYFESVTDKLLEDDNPFSNNVVVSFKSEELFSDTSYHFMNFRMPLSYDGNEDMEILEYVNQAGINNLSDLIDASYDYSPQGKVFATLIQNKLGKVFSTLDDNSKDYVHKKLSSTFHLKAFRDMVFLFGQAVKNSPYFTTYTYEDIKSGVGSDGLNACQKPYKTKNFKRFGRDNPYGEIGVAPFIQKYSGYDVAGRTGVYWKPEAAIKDTPLRDGKLEDGSLVEYVDVDKVINNISENYDWANKEKLDDPNHLTSMNYAILDQVIPEMVKFYCLDTAIKSGPVTKIFNNYGVQSIQDEIFATVILQTALKDLSGIPKFFQQAVLYWDRRFKKGEQPEYLTEQPTNGTQAVKALIQESLISSDEKVGAIEKANELINIKHLKDTDEYVDVALDSLFVKAIDSRFNIFPVPNFVDTAPGGLLVSDNTFYNTYDKLEHGGFAFEGYIKFFLHQETIDFFNTYVPNGDIIVDRLHNIPLSTDGLGEILDNVLNNSISSGSSLNIISNDSVYNQHPLETFLSYIVANILENSFPALFNNAGLNFQNSDGYTSFVGAPNESLFADIKYGIRLVYVNTKAIDVENDIEEFYSNGQNEESLNEIRKQKTFIYREAAPFDTGSEKILSFPIVEKEYAGSDLFNLKFNSNGEGSLFEKYEVTAPAIKEKIDDLIKTFPTLINDSSKNQGIVDHLPLFYSIIFFTKFANHTFKTTNKNMKLDPEAIQAAKEQANSNYSEASKEALDTDDVKGSLAEAFKVYQTELDNINIGKSDLLPNSFETKGFGWFFSAEKFSQAKLVEEFSKTKEWKALLNYALPQNLAAGLVAVYSYLNMLSGLNEKGKTFVRTKNLYKALFIFSMSRSGFDGKPTNKEDIATVDFEETMIPEEKPAPETQEEGYEEPDEC